LIHSDQGTQYGSDACKCFRKSNHLEPSRSQKGELLGNAVAESFFGSLKKEQIKKHIYKDRDLANAEIADCIEACYTRTRRPSHLGGVSLDQFEVAAERRRHRVY
jgi:putative transposase